MEGRCESLSAADCHGKGSISAPATDGKRTDTEERARLDGLVEKVIGGAYEVNNVLGAGFLEKIYERTLIEELTLRGIRARS